MYPFFGINYVDLDETTNISAAKASRKNKEGVFVFVHRKRVPNAERIKFSLFPTARA